MWWCGGGRWGGCGTVRCVHCGGWSKGVTIAFSGPLFDPKTSLWGSLGVILAPLRVHSGAPGPPGGPKGDPQGSKVDFLWIWGALGVPLGGHFGTILVTFSSLLVSKLQVALRTCFLSGFGMEQRPQRRGRMSIFHCNILFFYRFHVFSESLTFDPSESLVEPILEACWCLWGSFL